MKRSIRTQVLVALILVLGFGLWVSYAVTSSVTAGAVFDARIEQAKQLADRLAGRFASVLPGLAVRRAADALGASRLLVSPDRLFLVDEAGKPWFSTIDTRVGEGLGKFGKSQELQSLLAGEVDYTVTPAEPPRPRLLWVAQPLRISAEVQGVRRAFVLLGVDLSTTDQRNEILDNLLFLFTAVILGFALVLGYVALGRLVVTPIRRLLRPVERVRQGDFVQADPGLANSADLLQLYEAFNRMSAQLAGDREQIEHQVDALRQTNMELQATQKRLVAQEKLATVGTLAAGVAHEIGNPVAVLQGYLELVADPELTESQRQEYLAAMAEASRKIAVIIQDLLDFARPIDESTQICDVVAVVRATTKLVRPQSRFRGLELSISVPDAPVWAAINDGRLEQVILNLLLNAADASAAEGTVGIAVSLPDPETRMVRLTVEDEGTGISQETIGRMFDPFFTTKDPGEGTGLGLSICHNILSSCGGTIRAEARDTVGARVVVMLPAAPMQ